MVEVKHTPDDGGPAFPITGEPFWREGMSLRDWFAGRALAGMFAVCEKDESNWPDATNIAANAYRYADAMLAERARSALSKAQPTQGEKL